MLLSVKYGDISTDTTIFDVLGMPPLLEKDSNWATDLPRLRNAIRAGFPSKVIRALQKHGLSIADIASASGIAERTLKRRVAEERLDSLESDRLVRLAASIVHVMDELDYVQVSLAVAWLKTANEGLNGDAPLSRVDTEAGMRELDELLDEEKALRAARAVTKEREVRNKRAKKTEHTKPRAR